MYARICGKAHVSQQYSRRAKRGTMIGTPTMASGERWKNRCSRILEFPPVVNEYSGASGYAVRPKGDLGVPGYTKDYNGSLKP